MENTEAKRIKYVDIAKGLAIFLVIFGHCIDGVAGIAPEAVTHFSFAIAHSMIYGFHMHLFFMISGMFMEGFCQKPFKSALLSKVRRLVIPYFLWVSIVSIIKLVTAGFQNNPISPEDWLFSFIHPLGEFWFLYVLFFAQMLYYLFSKIPAGRWIFGALSLIAYMALPVMPDVWIARLLSTYSIFLFLGSLIRPILGAIYERRSLVFAGGSLLFALGNGWYIYLMYKWSPLVEKPYFKLLLALCGCAFILGISAFLGKFKGPLQRLFSHAGAKSMEIFCIHPVFSGGIRVGLFMVMGSGWPWIQVIVNFLVTASTCCIVFQLLSGRGFIYRILFGTR